MAEIYHYALKQHIGRASKAVVTKGEVVKRGQLIAIKPQEQLGAHIFTSVSGKVKEITEQAIWIEEEHTDFTTYIPLKEEAPLALIEEAGIVGLGGAGFPTSIKLKSQLTEEGVVIINGAECEPILVHNIGRIQQQPEKVLRGLMIVMEILKVKKGIVAIKRKHEMAVESIKNAIHQTGNKKVHVFELEDLYPMGEERALIREIKGELLPTDALPAAADAVVINVETALRIAEAVDDKKPLIDKDLTIAGKLVADQLIKVLEDVPIGKSVEKVFEMAGGLKAAYGELIMGGPFTGKRISDDAFIMKTTGGLIATETFLKGPEKIGLLVCACGADATRLEEIAVSMGSQVIGIETCKQAYQKNGILKCENPGHCPGQVGKVLALKKQGAQALLISNCTDCTNTVMSCAPNLGLIVYHCTDGALRAVNHKLIRRMAKE